VQERGLYFAHTWGTEFQPLLSMNDPDQPEQRGGLLVANVGEGRYVYTGLAFFRQLPAGVPGATGSSRTCSPGRKPERLITRLLLPHAARFRRRRSLRDRRREFLNNAKAPVESPGRK
jgi:hypothetical protein